MINDGKRVLMAHPLVSVIMPVRNGERFLPAAIQSVLAQEWRPLEIIVVDDHSTDGTANIARSHRMIHYVPAVNRGLASACNVGIAKAQGELVAFLSHDDLWTPDKLRSQIEYMCSHPEIGYTVGRVKFFLEPGFSLPAGFRRELLEGDHVAYIPETLVARKSVFDEVGGFDAELTVADDVDWFARVKDKQVPHAVIPKILVYKRVHDANLSLNNLANNQNLLKILRQSIARKRDRISKCHA